MSVYVPYDLFLLTGVYKPRVRCYETSQLSMKFERCLDSESKCVDCLHCLFDLTGTCMPYFNP